MHQLRRRAVDSFLSLSARTWPYSALSLAVGVLLVFEAPRFLNPRWTPLLEHVGIGFIVAAVVSLILHAKEVGLLFRDLARKVLVEHDYLRQLDTAAIRTLRSSASAALLGKVTDNLAYRRDELETFIDETLFTSLFPGRSATAGMYRDKYVEDVEIEILTLGDALKIVGADLSQVPTANLTDRVFRQTSTTQFIVVAPSTKLSLYPVYRASIGSWAADLTMFPKDKRVTYLVGPAEASAAAWPVVITPQACGGIRYEAVKELPFSDGQCAVWMRVAEFKALAKEPFVLNTMAYLTKGLTVDVNVTGSASELGFHAEGMGGVGQGWKVVHRKYGCKLEYAGWLLEDHGYFVSWW